MVSSRAFIAALKSHLDFVPTRDQETAMSTFADFFYSTEYRPVMIMRGHAGTGKTSLAGAIVRFLKASGRKFMLLAPTGRAAKVFSINSGGHPAFTIHRKIYRRKSFDRGEGRFMLRENLFVDRLFIIDEASMIADMTGGDSHFGTGSLLDDLISHVYSGRGCRMLLLGDHAQLPPVGSIYSPALSAEVMRDYGMSVYQTDMEEVLRQSHDSGILHNATAIRCLIGRDLETCLPQIRLQGFADICTVSGGELIESLASSYAMVGLDETIVVTRSNKRANIYNNGIRNRILGYEEGLSTGDSLMVVRNNYYWTERLDDAPDFVANGDQLTVRRVRRLRSLYGFDFADMTVTFPDYDDYEMTVTVLTETLTSDTPALPPQRQETLFNAILADYDDLHTKAAKFKRLKEDPYFNAMQVKYAYAITGHKAQGGQWSHVYIDQGFVTPETADEDYLHWLYTTLTRARDRIFLVNWPEEQILRPDTDK